MLSNEHKQLLLSGCRPAHAASVVGSAAMRWLRRADLGTDERAYPTAQNLYSLHTQIKISARHVGPLSRSCLPALLSSLTLSSHCDGGKVATSIRGAAR